MKDLEKALEDGTGMLLDGYLEVREASEIIHDIKALIDAEKVKTGPGALISDIKAALSKYDKENRKSLNEDSLSIN